MPNPPIEMPRAIAATITNTATLVAGKHTPVDASSAAITVNLPTAATGFSGQHISVEKFDTSTNVVTVTGNIRGATASITLAYPHETLELRTDATGAWFPTANHLPKSSIDAIIAARIADPTSQVAGALSGTYPTLNGSQRLAIGGAQLDPTKIGATSIAQLFGARKVLFGGDSITAGTGATSTTYRYSTQSARVAGTARAAEAINGGVAGDRSDQLLARMPALLAQGPDHVHVQIGTNDASQLVPLTTYQANIAAILGLCRAAGVTVSMGTVPPRGSSAGTAIDTLTRTYNLWLRFWTARQGILLADVFAALADPTTGNLASGYDGGDGTHPNNAGHLLMAQTVAPVMRANHLIAPWPVNAVSPIGLLSNPLINGTSGWNDQGGTGSATATSVASTGYDELPAGTWLAYRINNTTAGSVYRQIAATLSSSKYSPGDVLLICAWMNHSDATPGTATGAKLQLTNNGTAFAIIHDTTGSVNNPGPIMAVATVPASPGTLNLGMVLAPAANTDVTAYLGAIQVFNLTTGGLVGIA